MLTHTCPSCDTTLSATDLATLTWGIESHCCPSGSPFDLSTDDDDNRIVFFLIGLYKRPFVLFRPDRPNLMVT